MSTLVAEQLSPPDTIAVEEDPKRHRVPFSEIQRNLTYMETPDYQKRTRLAVSFQAAVDPMTPNNPSVDTDAPYIPEPGGTTVLAGALPLTPVKEPIAELDTRQWIQDILLWTTPALSALLFLVGGFLMLAGDFVLCGDHHLTLLTGTCYLLLADLAVNSLIGMVAPKAHASMKAAGSSLAASLAAKAADMVHQLAAQQDHFLSASNPTWTLKVASTLCVLATLGRFFSMWRLACLVFVAAFTVPLAYTQYQENIHVVRSSICAHVQHRWAALGLSRRAKASVLALGLLCLWVNSSWTTCMLTLLMSLLAGRCQLSAKEVAAISTGAAPMVHSARKRVKRMSLVAQDFARRHSLGGLKPHHR